MFFANNGLTTYPLIEISLYEYSAVVKLYSSSYALLETQTVSETKNINANTDFTFDIEVSRQVQLTTSSIDVVFTGESHDKPGSATQKHQVTFVYNNGTDSSKVVGKDGKKAYTNANFVDEL